MVSSVAEWEGYLRFGILACRGNTFKPLADHLQTKSPFVECYSGVEVVDPPRKQRHPTESNNCQERNQQSRKARVIFYAL